MRKNQHFKSICILFICIFIMSACSTICPPDEGPRSGGYIGYKCYKEKWEQEVALLKIIYDDLLKEQEKLKKTRKSLKEQKRMLADIEEKIKKVDVIISQYNKGTREALLKKKQIEQKIQKLKKELSKKPNQKEIARKTLELEELSNELATLVEIAIDLY